MVFSVCGLLLQNRTKVVPRIWDETRRMHGSVKNPTTIGMLKGGCQHSRAAADELRDTRDRRRACSELRNKMSAAACRLAQRIRREPSESYFLGFETLI